MDENENTYGPPLVVMEALDNLYFPYTYPDPKNQHLWTTFTEDLDHGASYFLVECGANELVDHIMWCVLDPHDNIIDFPPTFTMYHFYAGVNWETMIKIPRLSIFSLVVSSIIKTVKKVKLKWIVLKLSKLYRWKHY